MRFYIMKCPKCSSRMYIVMGDSEEVVYRCERCGYTVYKVM